MFQGILALIQIIPRLITLAERVGQWCIERDLENRLAALESAMEKIEGAKTPGERRDAAKDLAVFIRNLRG
jgi:hypothetical protein